MKKIFTLIAVAMMAVGANAQGKYAVAENESFTSKQKIESVANIICTLGEDTWAAGKKLDDKLDGYVAYTTGSTNPSDANGKKPGAQTFDATTAKGCVVHFKSSIDGHLKIAAKQNKGIDKPLYLFEDAQTEKVKINGNEESQYVFVEANITAGKNYCLYQPATKLAFFGFEFTTAAGINGVEATATAAPAVKKYVENGKLVIEKAGKKFTAAGAQLK